MTQRERTLTLMLKLAKRVFKDQISTMDDEAMFDQCSLVVEIYNKLREEKERASKPSGDSRLFEAGLA